MGRDERARRIAEVVGGVVRQAVRDAGATGVVLLDDGSPEARLAAAWCRAALGEDAVWPVEASGAQAPGAGLDTFNVHDALDEGAERERIAAEETHRYRARVVARARGGLVAHPANKTALLLGEMGPPEPLLPLGDLYASQVQELAGGWTAPPSVHDLVQRVGDVRTLDRVLAARVDERRTRPTAYVGLPQELGDAIEAALGRGRFWRARPGVVPKLGARTLGIDLLG